MSASPLTSARKCLLGVLLGGLLSVALGAARPARASDESVQIDCPERTTEQAAEVESRIRATLLTSEQGATVSIRCQAGTADVRVASSTDSVALATPTSVAGFRDEVLRAVEQAFEQLRARAHADTPPEVDTTEPVVVEPPPAEPAPTPAPSKAVAAAPPVDARVVAGAHAERRWQTLLLGAFLGESWHDRLALGGTLGIERSKSFVFYALRLGALRPATQAASFGAWEAHAALELGAEPPFAGGLRLALGVGPSVVFVSPRRELIAPSGTAKGALFVELHLSRPFAWSRWAVSPRMGLRLFTGERGVRIDAQEQPVLGGLSAQLSVEVAYRAK